MNDKRYKREHLILCRGILTNNVQTTLFTMKLIGIDDCPRLENARKKYNESIELEFSFAKGFSELFFHDLTQPALHEKFLYQIRNLQVGDTVRIPAAVIKDDHSIYLETIDDLLSSLPLIVSSEYPKTAIQAAHEAAIVGGGGLLLGRLRDTSEGVKKKKEYIQQVEREVERKRKKQQKKKNADRWKRFKQYFGEHPNTNQIIVTVIGTTIANQIWKIGHLALDLWDLLKKLIGIG